MPPTRRLADGGGRPTPKHAKQATPAVEMRRGKTARITPSVARPAVNAAAKAKTFKATPNAAAKAKAPAAKPTKAKTVKPAPPRSLRAAAVTGKATSRLSTGMPARPRNMRRPAAPPTGGIRLPDINPAKFLGEVGDNIRGLIPANGFGVQGTRNAMNAGFDPNNPLRKMKRR